MTTAKRSLRSGGQKSPNSLMSKPSTETHSSESMDSRTLFPAGLLASLSALPGSEKAQAMTVTSGLKCLELYPKSARLGCFLKTILGSKDISSPMFYLTWRARALKRSRLAFQLTRFTPTTGECGGSLLPTPTGQTARPDYKRAVRHGSGGDDLEVMIKKNLLPTPTSDTGSGRKVKYKQGGSGLDSVLLRSPNARDYKGMSAESWRN